jgi:DNA-binding Lrp family transcriptional regulator
MKIKNTHLKIINRLRQDSRMGFSEIGRQEKIPVTTIFDNYEKLVIEGIIRQHTSLLDYKKLGYSHRAFIFVKTKKRSELFDGISNNSFVNSIFKVNESDFLIDCIFPSMKEFYPFIDHLGSFEDSEVSFHEVIEPVKLEGFLMR